jgi:hypothetical protein
MIYLATEVLLMTPVKDGFKIVDMPKLDYKGRVLCNRCGIECDSDQLLYARPLEGFKSKYLSWYCPTWNCHGHLSSGVYFLSTSTLTEG